jgi:tyrosyl-tRNA synthetase
MFINFCAISLFWILLLLMILSAQTMRHRVVGRRRGILAKEVTALIHGEAGVLAAERISQALFSGDVSQLTENDLAQLALDGLPSHSVSGECSSLAELLVDTGLGG